MRVTDIQDFHKKTVKVYVDDKFAFVLYKGELRLYKISVGKDVAKEDYDKITKEVLPKRAKLRCMNLLKSRPYTEKRLRDKLKEGLYDPEIVDEALSYVKGFGYVNDLQYASDYLYYHGAKLTKRQVFQKLYERGVPKDVIEEAYETYTEENEVSEADLARSYLEKWHYDAAVATPEDKAKIVRRLLTKGFSYDVVFSLHLT
ncbi:MAG: RecX family transcriptional regulator [Lachnospiraceae bacterium]|nr:RecX family transcriptional regulator [Lachnospiraceae bacterium]